MEIQDKNFKEWVISIKEKYKNAQIKAAVHVNSELISFYYELGGEISQTSYKKTYGSKFYEKLSLELKNQIPGAKGFYIQNLYYIEKFYKFYNQEQILPQVGGKFKNKTKIENFLFKIPWKHHTVILDKCKTLEKALFYINKIIQYNWSRSVLINFLDSNLYEREGKSISNLTDIAKLKEKEHPAVVINHWMRNKSTLDFLILWEKINNLNFNLTEFGNLKIKPGDNSFIMPPKRFIRLTKAKGIKVIYGRIIKGTFVHKDIALEFASWISSELKLYIIKEFQRLKIKENDELEWNGERFRTKLNYLIQTDAIKNNLVPVQLTEEQKSYIYTSEADLLNVALFGMKASDWRNSNPNKKRGI